MNDYVNDISRSEKERNTRSIETNFQLKLTASVLFALVLGIGISTALIYFISSDTAATSYLGALNGMSRVQQMLLRATVASIAIQSVVVVGLSIAVILVASNKISGPIIRYRELVRGLGEGNFTKRATFRKGDQDHSLVVAFEDVSSGLRERIETAKIIQGNLESLLLSVITKGASSSSNSETTIERIREEARALRNLGLDSDKGQGAKNERW